MKILQSMKLFVLQGIVFSQVVNALDHDKVRKFTEANLKFTLDFYKTALAQNQKSFISSPFSVSSLFSMMLVGAEGKTAQEIESTLGYDDSDIGVEDVQDAYSQILGDERSNENQFDVDVANSVWNSEDFPITQKYRDSLRTNFQAREQQLNFARLDATDTINEWVNKETREKIPKIFDNPLPASTLLVLINAMYFKEKWQTQFPTEMTRNLKFQGENGNSIVPMMNVKQTFPYYQSDMLGSQVLEMDYNNSNMSMVVLLPNKGNSLKAMEENLTKEALTDVFNKLKTSYLPVNVSLPKFKLLGYFNLVPIMKKLKTREIFSSAADLSGISPKGGLFVTDAVQKAFVEVNEQGTIAAAASAVSLLRTIPIFVPFNADRPFMFLIRDKITSMIMFVGRYA